VSQHLRVLRGAGLVTVRPEGTRRLYRVDLDGLTGLRAWVDGFWDDALAAFVAHAEGEARP
jgi:DNA-binding transcriptional ArsR family regulator